MNIIEELKQINVNLNFAVEFRDGLVVRSEIKKIDALILKLSENLNGETLVSNKEFCDHPESARMHMIDEDDECTICGEKFG